MKFFAYAALVATTSANWFRMPVNQQQVQVTMPLDEMFKAVDANGDGALTMKEIMHVINKYCTKENHCDPPSRKEVKEIFDHVDENGDGKITMAEIESAIFDAVDTNDDGAWSLKEVFHAIKAVADVHHLELKKGWRKDVAHVFHEVDTNNDHKVTPAELKAAIAKHGYPDFMDLVKK